ncbi:MAG TPA: transporter substrate-binding domain-containing protein [Candidatus Omnitrophota bacterium]|nr:transporter substrate-binding domain-containing protein [Candidatus Omnitrophota bacterium]
MRRLLVATVLALSSTSAQSAEIVMAVGRSLPPYVIPGEWKGLEYDVVREALALEGHVVRPRLTTFARLVKELESGLVDAAMTMRRDSGADACYSDTHITYHNVAVTLARRDLRIDSPADLAGKAVLAFQNAGLYLGEAYRTATANNPAYREEAKQSLQPLLLFAQRTDVVVADRFIFGWFAASPEVTNKVDTSQRVRLHAIFPPTDYHVAFHDKALCESFNRGLKRLKESGGYARITARYTPTLAVEEGGLSR